MLYFLVEKLETYTSGAACGMGVVCACLHGREYGRYIQCSRDETVVPETSNLWVQLYPVTLLLLVM